MSATITVKLERELWELFRPFYQYPDQAVKEIAVLELYRRRNYLPGWPAAVR